MATFTSLNPLAKKTTLAPPSLSPPPQDVATEAETPQPVPPRNVARLAVIVIALASVAVGAAFAHDAKPAKTNGESQPRQTETGLSERWTAPTVTLVLDPSLEDLAPGATDAVRAGLGAWLAGVPGLPAVSFEVATARGAAAHDGKSVVLAAPITLAGHEKDLAMTTTYAEDATGAILEADIVFNTAYSFAVLDAGGCHNHLYDIGAVATHESGHFFGLGEDYDDDGATMYLVTKPCDTHKRALTSIDLAAITPLYARPSTMVAHCSAAPLASKGREPARGQLALAGILVAVALVLRRITNRISFSDRARAR